MRQVTISLMTYYGAKELAAAFRTVRKNTIIIAEEIPEDKYGFQATPETRTVAQTLVHVALIPRMPLEIHGVRKLSTFEGFDFMSVVGPMMADEQKPRTKAEILDLLRDEGEKYATFLDGLSDEFLGQTVSFPPQVEPPSKSRFEMLMGSKEHEMHHRGQLMLVQRMLGLTPHLTRQMQARMAAQQAGKP